MNDNELDKIKDKLMKPGWTENLHSALENLPDEDSKKIVESMTESEIDEKVNARRHQQDYIADYLIYLWGISKIAFWRHVKKTLSIDDGILWSDNMEYMEIMCKNKIPFDVLKAAIDFAVNIETNESGVDDLEAIGCVVKAQVENFDRLDEINSYISLLENNNQVLANERINKMLDTKCGYGFNK